MVDDRSKQVGRRLGLAVRVDETIESCLLDGLDVETWAREGLMDIVSLGSGATYCDIQSFRRITKGTGIGIYPCVYGYPTTPTAKSVYGSYSPEAIRGIAANYWANGADGMYTFNWGSSSPLNNEIGDPEALAGKDKLFLAYHASTDTRDDYYPHNLLFGTVPVELRPVHADTPLIIPVSVADDVAAAANAGNLEEIRLRVILAEAAEENQIEVTLNGQELPATSFEGSTIIFNPEPQLCRKGRNEIGLILLSAPSAAKPVVINSVDILVKYR